MRSLATVQGAAPGGHARRVGTVEVDQRAGCGVREEQARFLEALADRRDPEVEAALLEAEAPARLGVVEADADAVRGAIGRIEDAARKHPGAAGVVSCSRRAATGAPRDLGRRRERRRSSPRGAVAGTTGWDRAPGKPTHRRKRTCRQRTDEAGFECGTTAGPAGAASDGSDRASPAPPTSVSPRRLSQRLRCAPKMAAPAKVLAHSSSWRFNQEFTCFTMPSYFS